MGVVATEWLEWRLTEWRMNGAGGWTLQPIILVEGRAPFFADDPQPYIERLRELHDDPSLARGPFFALSGQLQDALEQAWNVGGD